MTIKVYIIQEQSDYTAEVASIKELNPDKIIILSHSEYEVDFIYRKPVAELQDYLKEHNKEIIILAPGFERTFADNVSVRPSYGHYIINRTNTLLPNINKDFSDNVDKADKLYTLYCNRRSNERIKLIDTFAREKLLDQGIVTFHNRYYIQDTHWEYHDGSPLLDEEDFLLNSRKEYAANELPRSFFRGLIDVVAESRVTDLEYYPSEKTMKSVITCKPFIVLSCQYYHRYLLEDYGIEPYTELFDYSFDNYNNIDDRIEAIVENIKNIQHMDKHEIYNKVKDKIAYNKQKFIEYGMNRDKMFPKDLEFILDDHILYGDTGNQFFNWVAHIKEMGWA